MLRWIFIFFVLFSAAAQGQTLSIKGILQDRTDKLPLAGATVILAIQNDSTNRLNAISGKDGSFEFKGLARQTYILKISSIAHDPDSQVVVLTDSSKDLGIISISKKTKLLEEVTIKAATPPVKQKADTLEYSANAFKVNPDANAEDMVKKMPGVTVDKGTVTAQGEQVRKVTIDGREFFGDDATAALRNLPAQVIDKIQVFDRMSDQAQFTGFDDGNSIKAINIVTRADMRNGQFGRLFAGYGTDDRYAAGGNVSFFKGTRRISLVGLSNNVNQQNFSTQDLLGVTSSQNRGGVAGRGGGGPRGGAGGRSGGGGGPRGGGGGFGGNSDNFLVGQQNGISKTNSFGINFSDLWSKKFEISGSYFFNNNNNTNDEVSTREYFGSIDSIRVDKENSISNSRNTNHRLNLRMEYKIDSNNSIMITPSVNFQSNRSFSRFDAENFFKTNSPISKSINNNNSYSDGYNINNSILYRHSFAKRRRTISLNLNTRFSKNDRESYIDAINNYYKGSQLTETDSLRQFSDQTTNGYQLSANLAYTEPMGKRGQLQINYNPSFSKNKADQQTFQFNDGLGKYSLFDTSLSNKYDNDYTAQRGGITYRIGDRDNMFSIGASYQHARLEGDQIFPAITSISKTFNNILPELMWRKKISAKSNLRLFYRGSTNEPPITQLQNVINNNNPLMITTGNPDLQQQYTHRLITRYSFTNSAKSSSLFANLFIEKTNKYIGNFIYFADRDSALTPTVVLRQGSQLSKPVNLDGYWSVRSFLTYGMPLKFIKSNLNWNAGFSWSKLPGIVKLQGMRSVAETYSNSYNYNVGAVLASNISELVDFNFNYSANFNVVQSSLQPDLNNNYFNHSAGFQLNLLSKNGWLFQNDMSNQYYKGLSDGFNQNFWLWNMSAGKKFLKDQKSEIKLSVFDLLKQNRSITRNVTESYTEDIQNQVLQQYFMLTFSYRLRNFGVTARQRNNQ
jgi:hypothetical protein